jgi:tRNA threonylcarbamoyladenosine biosynthesis protein TsaE
MIPPVTSESMIISEFTTSTDGPEHTRRVAARLASTFRAGDILCLIGDLGAGKTAFTQGLGEGLGVTADDPIGSPTFNLIAEHRSGRVPLFHFDVYRLADSAGLYDLAFDEYLDGSGVVVIEWADRIADALPTDRLEIVFSSTDRPDERTIAFRALGARAAEIVDGMRRWESEP